MVIIMEAGATPDQINYVVRRVESVDLEAQLLIGEERTVIAVIGDRTRLGNIPIELIPGVKRTLTISTPYKLASRQFRDEATIIEVNGTSIGGKQIVVMVDICAVESTDRIFHIAKQIAKSGVTFIQVGKFKPHTGPYSFRSLDESALGILAEVKKETGLGIITEVMTPHEVEVIYERTDVFRIETDYIQDFYLMHEVGKSRKPVLLTRSLTSTLEEYLLAAESILSEGNSNVILCEQGIRTFETHTRNTLDLNVVPAVKELSHLPIVVNPSNGTGLRRLVTPMSKAAVAAGADGLLIEVQDAPDDSMTGDGGQSLSGEQFNQLMQELQLIAGAIGRNI